MTEILIENVQEKTDVPKKIIDAIENAYGKH